MARVNAGFDFPLCVELHQLQHGADNEIVIGQEAQVEATDGFVGLHQFQRSERKLVVPGLCNRQQVPLLACNNVSCTYSDE